ncbi:MAG TPA: YtxH domain-containing protein [Candidatus Saccharimonadales bacterium]|nr:YtxH domain-containing protein [Candidatus Saccharimonadales bacterium]
MSKSTNVIVAAAAGFIAGILCAPKSGAETRKDVKDKSLEAKEYADQKAVQAKQMIAKGRSAVAEHTSAHKKSEKTTKK